MGYGSNRGRPSEIGRPGRFGRVGAAARLAGALLRSGGRPEKGNGVCRTRFGSRLGAKERARHV